MLLEPGHGGIFQVSPNGKLVGIQAIDHINVIELNGRIVHRDLATYPPSWPYDRWPDIYWTQGSDKLNLLLPLDTGNALDSSGPEPRTILQYSMDGKPAVEFHLNPPPIGESFSISPDGDWIIYTYYYYPGKTDETITAGIYIGDLRDGSSELAVSSQPYGLPYSFYWNPDSESFVFENERSQIFLGNINRTIIPLAEGNFLGWIDDSSYLYLSGKILLGNIENEAKVVVTKIVGAPGNSQSFTFVFIKHDEKNK
jgi:hypothetical protein